MSLRNIHERIALLLGDEIGIGIAHSTLLRLFDTKIMELSQAPLTIPSVPGFGYGLTLAVKRDDGAGQLLNELAFRVSRPILQTCTLEIVIHVPNDKSSIFRKIVWQFKDVELDLVDSLSNRFQFRHTRIGVFMPPALGVVDQVLVEKHYPTIADYLEEERSVKERATELLGQFVREIPFPDLVNGMLSFKLGSPKLVRYDNEYVIVSSPSVETDFPGCARGFDSLGQINVVPSILGNQTEVQEWQADVVPEPNTTSDPIEAFFDVSVTLPDTIGHGIQAKVDILRLSSGAIVVYYPRIKCLQWKLDADKAMISVTAADRGESFFVRWYYGITGALKSLSLSFDPGSVKIHASSEITAIGSAGGTIKIGCVDIFSGSVGVDGAIWLDCDVSASLDQARQMISIVGSVTIPKQPVINFYGLPFPFNLVVNLVLKSIAAKFVHKTVASWENVFRFPVVDIPSLVDPSYRVYGIAEDVLQDSHLVTMSFDG